MTTLLHRGGLAAAGTQRRRLPQPPSLPPCLARSLFSRPACLGSPSCSSHQLQPSTRHDGSQTRRVSRTVANAATGSAASEQPGSETSGSGSVWPWIVIGLAVAAGAGLTFTEQGQALRAFLANGPLGRSGFLAAFSLIFLSEIGDKTFFIAALLAMKIGKWVSFFGSVSALSVMTVISVGIGAVCSRVPDALKSSIPIGELAGVALLVFFGLKALKDGLKADEAGSVSDEELADAESVVKGVASDGKHKSKSLFGTFFEVATLIFLAEWGDRSMLATIALGAAQNPVGVAVGAIAGHAIATGIAVVGGAFASKYVSEKTVNVTSGVLFLLFAAATAYGMLA